MPVAVTVNNALTESHMRMIQWYSTERQNARMSKNYKWRGL